MFKLTLFNFLLITITIANEKPIQIFKNNNIQLYNYIQLDTNNQFIENSYLITAKDNRYRSINKSIVLYSSNNKQDIITFLYELIHFSQIPNDDTKYYPNFKLSKHGKYNSIWIGSGFYSYTKTEMINILNILVN